MSGRHTLTPSQASTVDVFVVDLRITQVANDVWGVHAVLSAAGLGVLGA